MTAGKKKGKRFEIDGENLCPVAASVLKTQEAKTGLIRKNKKRLTLYPNKNSFYQLVSLNSE